MSYPEKNNYTHLLTACNSQIFTGVGQLVKLTINTTAGGTIKIVDGTSSPTTTNAIIGILKASVAEQTFHFECSVAKGLRIVQNAASDTTVTWNQ